MQLRPSDIVVLPESLRLF